MEGGTTWNILSNISRMNFSRNAYAIGICGNDSIGDKAIESLKKSGINVDRIEKRNKLTNIVFSIIPQGLGIDKQIRYTTVSPFTKRDRYNLIERLPLYIDDKLKRDCALIIIENFREENIQFINQFRNKKVVMDIGRIKILNGINRESAIELLKNINMAQISAEVLDQLLIALSLKSVEELYEIINPDLMIITNGRNKTKFMIKEKGNLRIIEKTPRIIEAVKDTTGAGDSFFSVIINAYSRYIEQDKEIDSKFINDVFPKAQGLSEEIIKQVGGRCDNETINNWKKNILKENIR